MVNKLQIFTLVILALAVTSFVLPQQGQLNLASNSDSFSGYSFTGRVESMGFGQPITIKFLNLNRGATTQFEEVKLCDINENTIPTVMIEQKLDRLKKAWQDKSLVRVSYNSLFDKCLRDVVILSGAAHKLSF